MKIKDVIHWIDIARMGYICDPNDCGLKKGGDLCRAFHCDEIHDALVMAMEVLEIADKLEQADVISNEEIYIKACKRYGCWESECPHRARDRFCSDLAEIFFDGYNQALADMRGDAE